MFVKLGQWLPALFGYVLPIPIVLAFCDLIYNTGLSLAFGGYNTLRIRTAAAFKTKRMHKEFEGDVHFE